MHILILIIFFSFMFSQSWSIDTTSSYIKYTGTHPLHSWEGISKDIAFFLDCEENQCTLKVSTPLENFDSGNDSRDSNMLYYTESLLYPIVSLESSKFIFNDEIDTSVDLNGMINFHDIDREIPIKVLLIRENDLFRGTCNFNINLDSFNTERPSLLMIKISNIIEIEANFTLIKND